MGAVGVPVSLGAQAAGVPASWLVGPMLVAVALSATGVARAKINRIMWRGAQAVVGIAISASFDPSSLRVLARLWPAMIANVVVVLGLAVIAGALLARLTGISGATSAIGTLPGGAAGMVSMAEDLGGDPRTVAFMQYVRLILTVLSVTLAAPLFSVSGGPSGPSPFSANGTVTEYAVTAGAALVAALLGIALRIPAGALIGPVVAGVILGSFGVAHGAWPFGVLPAAYAVVGMRVGAQFDRESLQYIGRLAPAVLLFALGLMGGCALLAAVLTATTSVDGLTWYLSTAPGGMDSVMIVALDTGARTSVVLGMQMVRLLAAILIGPMLVPYLGRRVRRG